jgi:hypothetical protein
MPLGFGPIGTITSSSGGDITGGRNYTRLRGSLLLGSPGQADIPVLSSQTATIGANVQPPHVVNVSTVQADMLISVVSSFAGAGATSSGMNTSTGSPKGLVYITQSTGAGNMVHAGSTANAPVGLPGGANGVALVWDAVLHTLCVYEPGTSAWMTPHTTTAGAATLVWSACSS